MDKYKNLIIRSGVVFFGIALIGIGGLQILFTDFESVVLPYWPEVLPGRLIAVYVASLGMIVAGIVLLLGKRPTGFCLWLGVAFFVLFVVGHLPWQLIHNLHSMGPWTNSLKTLTFSGGALILSDALKHGGAILPTGSSSPVYQRSQRFSRLAEKLISVAPAMISVFLIFCGIEHFVYAQFVQSLVPAWVPGALFWTYFAGVALIGAGLAILFRIWLRVIAGLLGTMIFLWVLMLHIPRAAADPMGLKANECVSVFEALAFSGFAFVLAVDAGRIRG